VQVRATCAPPALPPHHPPAGGLAQTLRLSDLPLTRLLFLPDGSLVGVGHCFNPILFVKSGAGWVQAGKLVTAKKVAAAESGVSAARSRFMAQAATGQGEKVGAAATLDSVHQFAVCGISAFGRRAPPAPRTALGALPRRAAPSLRSAIGSQPAEFTTSALDGKIVFWTRDELAAAMQSLTLG
jgi:actin related protein 2/3 complex subunit 1A/1B